MLLLIIYGIINSSIILLQTIGFGLTFSISGIPNLSYGALYILGGILSWTFLKHGFPLWLSILLSCAVVASSGFFIYWIFLYRIRGAVLLEVIVSFALGIAIIEFLRWKGFVTYEFSLPALLKGSTELFGIPVDFQRILIVLSSFFLIILLYLFSHYTKLGLALRGVAQNEQTALSVGINSDLVSSVSMMIGSGICAFSASLILPLGIISMETAYDVLLVSICVSVVGGLGSILGMLLASLIFGFIKTAISIYLSSKWMMLIYFISILFVLMIRPSGLFGKLKQIEERI